MPAQSFGQRPQSGARDMVAPKQVGFLLGLGILLAPWLFAWILLRPGYSRLARIFGLGWCAVVIFGIYHHDDRMSFGSAGQPSHAASGGQTIVSAKTSAAETPGETWQYSTSNDQMRGVTTSYAELLSSNTLDFGFPYAGGSTAKLVLRRRSGENAVMLMIDKGQFTCFNGVADRVLIKFDAGPISEYSCDRPADGSSNVVFLGPEDTIIRQVKTAQQVTVEAQFYQEGSRQMTFHTAGLKW